MAHPWKDLTPQNKIKHSRGRATARGRVHLRIPLPPLRFFLLSVEEICDVYQPKH